MEIDEESFATRVFFIEEFVIAGFIRGDRIGTVHRLVGVESGREILDIIETKEESEDDNRSETKEHRRERTRKSGHSVGCCLFFVSYDKIIA